jgi:hypothetical protein
VHSLAGMLTAIKFKVSARASRLNSAIAPLHNLAMTHCSTGELFNTLRYRGSEGRGNG